MTWKFKKTKNYEKMRMFSEIETELMPEAHKRKLFDLEPGIS